VRRSRRFIGGGGVAQPHRSELAGRGLLGLVDQALGVGEYPTGGLDEHAPGFGGPGGAGAAMEQRHAQVAFEVVDRPGERRLGNVQLRCGGAMPPSSATATTSANQPSS
jgi:hypothetical protein